MTDNQACNNTDRDLWFEDPSNSAYSPRLFITETGGIGIDVGGLCFVQPIREWHRMAALKADNSLKRRPTVQELEAILNSEDERPIKINPDGSIGLL